MRTIYTKKLVPRARELRREMTAAERKLWFCFLRSHSVRFRRQVPLQGYILDFYAPSLKICIELDGGVPTMVRQPRPTMPSGREHLRRQESL